MNNEEWRVLCKHKDFYLVLMEHYASPFSHHPHTAAADCRKQSRVSPFLL